MNPSNKVVFVTGGARRLGREIALHLRETGFSIVVHYNKSRDEALSLQTQTGCRLFQADFTSIRISELVDRLENEVGEVDALINNASVFQMRKWNQIDEQLWDEEMAVNLKMPFFLARHFGSRMKKKGSGKIINMSDIAAERPYLNYLPYSIARAGVPALTRALARILAPEVQVNAIAPGSILFAEDMPVASREAILKKIPARRTATTEELLHTVDFLLSDVDYITGQTIVLDGGRSL